MKNLAEQYTRVQEMVQEAVPELELIPVIEAIPPRTEDAIEGLLNYIAHLERELAKKRERKTENY